MFDFPNEKSAEKFKLFVFYNFLKNTSRTSKINLSSPKGYAIVDNNSGFITLKYESNGDNISDSIPVNSILD